MLVRFSSDANASVLMFGDVARVLLDMMGQSGRIPGALAESDVPGALECLKVAIAASQTGSKDQSRSSREDAQDERTTEPPVGIAARAYPLLLLMEASVRSHAAVVWERA